MDSVVIAHFISVVPSGPPLNFMESGVDMVFNKQKRVTVAIAGMALLLSACGSSKPNQTAASSSTASSGTSGGSSPSASGGTSSSAASGSANKSPYTLNAVLGVTGQAATLAQTEKKSLGVYVKNLNAHGGINGHPLKLNIQDDENNPKLSVQIMTRLNSQHVPVVIGPTLGETAAPDEAIFKNGPTVDYALTPAFAPPPFGSYVFSAALGFGSAAQATLNYIESKGWTRIAFLDSTDTSGHSADLAFQAALKMPQYKNLQVVTWQHFAVSDVSVAAQMSVITSKNPQILIAFATGAPFGTVVKGVVNSGFSKPVLTDDGNMTYAELDRFPTMPSGGLYMSSGAWDAANVLTGKEKAVDQQFLDLMKQAGIKPDVGSVLPWDPVSIVVSALKKYGVNATGKQIHQYIESQTDYPGVMGMYNFSLNTIDSRQRGLSTASDFIYKWISSSKGWQVVSHAGGKTL